MKAEVGAFLAMAQISICSSGAKVLYSWKAYNSNLSGLSKLARECL